MQVVRPRLAEAFIELSVRNDDAFWPKRSLDSARPSDSST